MYFDGASHKEGVGAGVVFVTSEGEVLPYSFTLTQKCSNNVAVDQALILGLEIAVDIKQLPLKIYGDAQLVTNGVARRCRTRASTEEDNKQADALAKLASTLSMTDKEARIPICKSWVIPPIFSDDEDDTFQEKENIKLANSTSSGGHLLILAATDYFSKWAEAVPLKEVKKENVADFIRTHIIYRYGVPRNSYMYYAAANGLAEAFNKTWCNLLKKVVAKSKRDWHERIGEAL
ncbi:hypothetical protein Sango_1175200 [Sesamum angolense]|uniref:RNase H type-1 domain-containing protein n=1 Tax=Sesamum angolense TaxID=2727404 RepID=A0AAE1WWI1_9LAMI|nr:hypothetical protein Sango_1175200 [Sesamum angolense]